MRKIKVGILGIGNVAKGTYIALEQSRDRLKAHTGLDIEIVKILNRRPEVDRGIDIPKEKYVTDAYEIINDPEIDIVVELIGGIEPATEFMAAALANGKPVVTANKAAIAANGERLQKIAQDNKVMLRFEASVGGGIPILNAINNSLMSNEFNQVLGILNGTTNYILTQMMELGRSYEEVLKDAQKKGFAEADPTADVEGLDVANKLSILISLIIGIGVLPDQISTRGITSIASEDIGFARESGYKIKLIGSARSEGDNVYCSVEPSLVPVSHPLAGVSNEFNAVHITGNAVDDLMFYGKGAGPLPTGSAVLGDIVIISKQLDKDAAYDILPPLRYDAPKRHAGVGESKYYIRVTAIDKPGVLGKITSTLGNYEIGIETALQRAKGNEDAESVPLIFIVYKTDKRVLDLALEEITEKDLVESVDAVLRVL